jgi:hypothetical protein
LTTLPVPFRPVTGATPESMTATSIPAPVRGLPVLTPPHSLSVLVAYAALTIEVGSEVGS